MEFRQRHKPTKWFSDNQHCYNIHTSRTIQVRWTRCADQCWRSKDRFLSDILLRTPSHGHSSVGRPTRTYLQQLCANTVCSLEDLLEVMDDRNRRRERVREICACSATRWWWWWYIYIYIYIYFFFFSHEHLKHQTALSKHFWSLKNKGLTPEI